jgi:hypothetical protein
VCVGGKANHPYWGFLYLCAAACSEWKEKAGAPLPRRAIEGRSRRPCSCVALGEGGAEDREPGTRSGGSTNHDVEPGEERDADVNTYVTWEHLLRRNTDATTPAGRPRLHRRPLVSTAAFLLSSPPWILPVMTHMSGGASL